jgi:hypothetical protein
MAKSTRAPTRVTVSKPVATPGQKARPPLATKDPSPSLPKAATTTTQKLGK